MLKIANVYLRGTAFFIRSVSNVDGAHWIATGPCMRLPIDCNDLDLGGGVMSALEHSEPSVPHPGRDGWKAVLQPLLEAANVKTWSTFIRSAYNVRVSMENGSIEITPLVNRGARQGFVVSEPIIRIESLALRVSVVGSEVRRSLLDLQDSST